MNCKNCIYNQSKPNLNNEFHQRMVFVFLSGCFSHTFHNAFGSQLWTYHNEPNLEQKLSMNENNLTRPEFYVGLDIRSHLGSDVGLEIRSDIGSDLE